MNFKLRIALELERLRRRNLQRLHPLQQLFWECTLRCNLQCLHCGSDCKMETSTPDMPREHFFKVLDEQITPNVNPHYTTIILSGGEPLMRQDISLIGNELYARGYPWGMVSNGMLLTNERLQELLNAGMRTCTISLDGTEQDHNWLRQHPNAFKNATNAIKYLAKTNIAWDVVTCVNKRNINQLEQIFQLLWQLGCTQWRLFTIAPMGRAKINDEMLLNSTQYADLLQFIATKRRNGFWVQYACEGFLGKWEGQVRSHLYHCAAGISVASILCDGNISACTSIRGKYFQGNIYKDNFWDVWQQRFQPYRNRQWMRKTPPCSTCSLSRYCEGNGMHLRDEDGNLMRCNLHALVE